MLAGMILGAAVVIAVLMFFVAGKSAFGGERQILSFAAVGLVIAGAVIAVVIHTNRDDANLRLPNSGMSVADLAKVSVGLGSSRPSSQAASRVASVPSLIDGLERRLESEPENASGWALLAQSYSFVGESELAETALRRAIDLGLDETDLRARVISAQRDPHTGLDSMPGR